MGPLANITQEGFAPAAFHSYPSTLEIDGYVCDYGSGFYGYAVNSTAYIYNHSEFGWLAFSGNIVEEGDWINTEITTAGKNRVFIAPESLKIETVSGQIQHLAYNPKTREVRVDFEGDLLFSVILTNNRSIKFEGINLNKERGYYKIKSGKKNQFQFIILGTI